MADHVGRAEKIRNRERGATAVEYAVILFFVVLASIATIYLLQDQLAGTEANGYDGVFTRIANSVGTFGKIPSE